MLLAFAMCPKEKLEAVTEIQHFEMDFRTSVHDMYLAKQVSFFHDVFYGGCINKGYEEDDD